MEKKTHYPGSRGIELIRVYEHLCYRNIGKSHSKYLKYLNHLDTKF